MVMFGLMLAACATAPRPVTLTATATPTSTPPTEAHTIAPTPGPELVQPPSSLWRAAVPPEALETRHALEAVDVPPRDLIDLTKRLSDPGRPIPRVVRDAPWGFEVGDTHEFWVLNRDAHEYVQVTARLVYETPHAYFFLEEGVDLNQAKLKRLADRFEEATYPTNREFFGEEWSPGVDNDPHVTILFARTGGIHYQNSIDEFSRLVNRFSNEMELVYISADDEQLDDDCMLAHEFQHVIQWAVDSDEETWLFEGFSELACPINGLTAWYAETMGDAFARQPDIQLNAWSGEMERAPAQYGASYLFLTYFLDRFGKETMRALVAHQENGLDSLDAVLSSLDVGIGFDDVFADWVVANYINDPNLAEGRYGYLSLLPPSFAAEADYQATDLPVERQASVSQYGADYIVLRGAGNFQVDFVGATLVGLAPTSAHAGKYAWWGGRGTNSDTSLTREFDLTGLQKATLTFHTWYDIERDFDYAYVEASRDGQRWTTLAGQTTTDYDPNGANYGNGYTGVSDGWIQEKVDLTSYAGHKVHIRFEYVTDDGPVHAGIFLDDIRIPELDLHHDAESGDAGWVARGFTRSAMLMPQEWLLQLVTQGHDRTTVERLQLNPDNTGRWRVSLDSGEAAVLIVSGRTRVTTEPAEYWYAIRSIQE